MRDLGDSNLFVGIRDQFPNIVSNSWWVLTPPVFDLANDHRVILVHLDAAVRILDTRLLPRSDHAGVVDVLGRYPTAVRHASGNIGPLRWRFSGVRLPDDRVAANDDNLF